MLKLQTLGVEKLAWCSQARPSPAIHAVAYNGMPNGREMDPDLVRATCPGLGIYQAVDVGRGPRPLGKLLQHVVFGNRITRAGEDGHSLAVARITANGRLDSTPVWLQVTV